MMRPCDTRHSSIARSTAQSECCELSTGAKISRYTGTSDARVHAGHTPISPRARIGFGPIEITPGVMLGRSGRQAAADYRGSLTRREYGQRGGAAAVLRLHPTRDTFACGLVP